MRTNGRKKLLFIGCLALGLVLSACGSSGSPNAASGKKNVTIAYMLDTNSPATETILAVQRAQVAKINAASKTVHLTFNVYNANGSSATQLQQWQTAILKKPSVLLMNAVSTAAEPQMLSEAKAAHIPVVDYRPTSPEPAGVAVAINIYYDPYYTQYLVGWLKSYLKANPTKTLNVGVEYGLATQTPQLIRGNAILALAKEMPTRVKILATAYDNWSLTSAQSIAEDWLVKYPQMNYIVSPCDCVVEGIITAVKSAHKSILDMAKPTGQIMISGYDDQLPQLVADGQETVDVGIHTAEQAQAVVIAYQVATGTWKGGHVYINHDDQVITGLNAAQWIAQESAK